MSEDTAQEGAAGSSTQEAPSFCGEDMMKRMAEACDCGAMASEKPVAREQTGASHGGASPRCCGGDAAEVADADGRDEDLA